MGSSGLQELRVLRFRCFEPASGPIAERALDTRAGRP